MYQKILIPTDGSALSLAAAIKGIEFAHGVAARVLALYVAPPYEFPMYLDSSVAIYPTEAEYKILAHQQAKKALAQITAVAQRFGISCEEIVQFSAVPAQAIVACAKRKQCGLIFMGSHGRSGVSKLFLGSVTHKVLSACTVPVLVHRAGKQEIAKAQKALDQVAKPTAANRARRSAAVM
jgi:nucleotide-binding universal stress UspA family protein